MSEIDLTKAKDSVIVRNHWKDPSYAPYCMRCRGFNRMTIVEPYLFRHGCGAIHDERQVIIVEGPSRSNMIQQQSPSGRVTDEIWAERDRQKTVEGWLPEHDDMHKSGELSAAAASYALYYGTELSKPPIIWPFEATWWKPKTSRRDLIRAAALIVAEIERLDRREVAKTSQEDSGGIATGGTS